MDSAVSRVSRFAGLALLSCAVTIGCAQLLGLKEDVPPTPCVLNSDCSPNELCIFRVCSAACKLDKDCLPGSRCLDTNGSAACVASQGTQCSADADGGVAACPDGSVCDATQTCRNSCTSCHADQNCVADVCVGTDPTHDPGATGAGGTDGSGGGAGGTGVIGASGAGDVGGSVANGGRVGTGGATGAAGKGSTTGGSGPLGDAGAPSVIVTCGDTAVGAKAPCNELPNGTAINFPGGMPQGPCAAGTKLCNSDGTFGACTGAVPPAQTDCTSASDNNCNGKADNTECGVCTASATQYCYDGAAGTVGVGTCKSGTQVCQLDASKTTTVWGPCAGEVTPATNDTCDSGNDATCNNVPNEGCACINNVSEQCGLALAELGNCAKGVTKCAGGSWGACSVAAKGRDTCDPGDDSDCDGSPNEGCTCVNAQTQPCGSSGTGCTLGTETCDAGAWSACNGNVCGDFAVTPPAGKCSAGGVSSDDIENSCTFLVCPTGYYVSNCNLTPSSKFATCQFDIDGTNPAYADVTTDKGVGTTLASCSFASCTCRLNGF